MLVSVQVYSRDQRVDMKTSNILLIGAGNIGFRYLQGILKSKLPIKIWVVDVNPEALQRAQNLVEESPQRNIELKAYLDLDFDQIEFNLAIISTLADIRLRIVQEVRSKKRVGSFILEKVLTQSASDSVTLYEGLRDIDGAWINYPRRVIPIYKEIALNLCLIKSAEYIVSGENWNLASNSLHFIDVVEFISGSTLKEISTNGLQTKWRQSRSGFYDVLGTLVCHFMDGSILKLESKPFRSKKKSGILMRIEKNQLSLNIDEDLGVASGDLLKNDIYGEIELQSVISTRIVEQILINGKSELTSLDAGTKSHLIFIEAMLEHWNQSNLTDSHCLPIT